ncbi:MAG TPA: GDP-mannose 4,6-dehydratase, partial [Acetobacteraceae bacterium]
ANLLRPAEVEVLLGDPSKARQKLGWHAEVRLEEMVAEMVEADLARHQARSHVSMPTEAKLAAGKA